MPRKMAREPGTDAATTPPQPKKIDSVIALLRRQEGASLDEMVEATSLLPHTTRAALTGLDTDCILAARNPVAAELAGIARDAWVLLSQSPLQSGFWRQRRPPNCA